MIFDRLILILLISKNAENYNILNKIVFNDFSEKKEEDLRFEF